MLVGVEGTAQFFFSIPGRSAQLRPVLLILCSSAEQVYSKAFLFFLSFVL
jgi:hypothetical protein